MAGTGLSTRARCHGPNVAQTSACAAHLAVDDGAAAQLAAQQGQQLRVQSAIQCGGSQRLSNSRGIVRLERESDEDGGIRQQRAPAGSDNWA